MNIEDINDRMTELATELEELAAVEGDLEEAAQTRWDEANAEFDELRTKREALEERARRIDAIRSAATNPENRVGGDGAIRTTRVDEDIYDLRAAPRWGMGPGVLGNEEIRERARRAVDAAPPFVTAEQRETVNRHLDNARYGPEIAEHVLRTGSPTYHRAFEKFLRDPSLTSLDAEERAAMSLSNTAGGFLVPFTLDPTIILTNDGATNPFREIATVKTITTDDWNGVTSAGVTAEWLAEATEAADASPTFAQPSITANKAAAYIQASFEIVADSGVAGDIGMLIADAKGRLEATAFATGSGSGQPQGIVTGISGVTASRVAGTSGAAGAADYVVGDVYAVANALPPRYRGNSSWVAEQSILNKTRQFATGSGPQHAFWADLGAAIPPLLLGRPVYESSAMDSTIVSGSNDDILILGDFRYGYYIIDRVGLAIAYNPLVLGSNRRPTGEVGWFAYWRVGGKAVDTNAFRMLRV